MVWSTTTWSAVEVPETLPASSVCLTVTSKVPSPPRSIDAPLPAMKAPPLTEYCQVALVSMPLTFTTLLLVSPSLLLLPVSASRARSGVAGAAVSTTTCRAVDEAEALPAKSVCLTETS